LWGATISEPEKPIFLMKNTVQRKKFLGGATILWGHYFVLYGISIFLLPPHAEILSLSFLLFLSSSSFSSLFSSFSLFVISFNNFLEFSSN